MKKESIAFGLAGALFGLVAGYVIAFQIYAPRTVGGEPRPADRMPVGEHEAAEGEDLMAQVTGRIEHLKGHAAQNPKDPVPLLELGEIYFQAGYFQDAESYYRRVVEIDAGNLDARTALGICLVQMDRPAEARDLFRGSVAIDPEHWQSWLNLGLAVFASDHDLAEAEKAFAQVDRLRPGLPELEGIREEIRRHLAAMPSPTGEGL